MTSKYCVLLLSPLWKEYYLHPLHFLKNNTLFESIILYHIIFTRNGKKVDGIYKSRYSMKHKVFILSKEETTFLNQLIINDARKNVIFTSHKCFLETIKNYDNLSKKIKENTNHNFNKNIKFFG